MEPYANKTASSYFVSEITFLNLHVFRSHVKIYERLFFISFFSLIGTNSFHGVFHKAVRYDFMYNYVLTLKDDMNIVVEMLFITEDGLLNIIFKIKCYKVYGKPMLSLELK